MKSRNYIFLILLVLLFLSPASTSFAQTVNQKFDLDEVNTELYKIEADIKDQRFLLPKLDDYLDKLPRYTAQANGCINTSAGKLKEIEKRLVKLGEEAEGEPTDVAFIRKSLNTEKQELINREASCKAILVRSEEAIKDISLFRKKNLERKSFDRGDSILDVLHKIHAIPSLSETRLVKLLESSRGVNVLSSSEVIMLLSILIITTAIALYIRSLLSRWDKNSLIRWEQKHLGDSDTGTRFIAAFLMTVRRYVLSLLLSTSLATFVAIETIDRVPTPLITIVLYNLPLLILSLALIYFIFIALPSLGLRKDISKKVLISLRFRLAILAIIIYLGHLLFQTILSNSLTEETFFLVRAILAILLVMNIIWALWLTRYIKGPGLSTHTLIIVSLVLSAAVVAELTGYRNLAGFILKGVTGSLISYALFQVFHSLLKHFLEEINTGKSNWQRHLRRSVGISDGATISGFIWIQITAVSLLWLLFFISLLYIWDLPGADINEFSSYITEGFSFGSFRIVPLKIFEAVLVLVILLTLNGWFQKRLEKKFLTKVNIERGARESISTISNYIGIALVIVISLAIIGMDFSKLAIIAGALSVGIGFGLQNVVNNFVSGLILLFERPIKTGDWIEAGGVEGTVKKISIRSTQIQSFDGADIIIPNSELISSNLTNWELRQKHGRVRVPIGVAYGSDTAMVKELLLSVASTHKAVIQNKADTSDPQVIFLSFGDSALNFELRFFIQDIKKRLRVLSDINFSIDAIFRENKIEIPFPQRDIHIKSTADDDPSETIKKKDNAPD